MPSEGKVRPQHRGQSITYPRMLQKSPGPEFSPFIRIASHGRQIAEMSTFPHAGLFTTVAVLGMLACGGRVGLVSDDSGKGGSLGGAGSGGGAQHGGSGGKSGGAGASGSGGSGLGGKAGSAGTGGLAGSAGTGGLAGNAGSAGAPCSCGPHEQCWNEELCVAKLVAVPGGYSIDATEVTRSQYQAWLATDPSKTGQPLYCLWNTEFAPDADCMQGLGGPCGSSDCSEHPQACIDWCDARAYCAAVGKRLCGRIGGGHSDFAESDDANVNQWYNVCSSHGATAFTYGDTYEPLTCRTRDEPVCYENFAHCHSAPVASYSECQGSGPYAGVFDLSGNVYEWEDSCEQYEGAADDCRVRGGSYFDIGAQTKCTAYAADHRRSYLAINGFRCCSL